MIATRVVSKASLHVVLAATLTAVALLTTGCSGFNTVASTDTPAVTGAAIQGTVHGGQSPINGSSVQLWVAGTGGYGLGASALGSAVLTNSSGTFAYGTYVCPGGNPQVYLTASGGDAGSGANAAIVLAAALGPCNSLSSPVFVNEVTTAATAYSLGQYFNPALGLTTITGVSHDTFGSASTAQAEVGIANAFATSNNLVSNASGAAVQTAALSGAGTSVTATPEYQQLNTVANILAACVNSTGAGSAQCTKLFTDTPPPGYSAPTDTLQAAIYMSLNPTCGGNPTTLADLFTLQTGTSPFTGVGSTPNDLTIGILYADTTPGTFLLQPQNIAADSKGNIYVANGDSAAADESLVELSPTGTPTAIAVPNSIVSAQSPRNIAIDTNNNVWMTTSSSSADLYEYLPVSSTYNVTATHKGGYGIAIDGSNDVFVGLVSSSANFQLIEYQGGNIADTITYPIASATPGTAGVGGASTFLAPDYMAFDTSGNLWMTNAGASTTSGTANEVVVLSNINTATQCPIGSSTYPCPSGSVTSGTGLTTSVSENTYTAYAPTTMATPYGIAADTGASGMWTANSATGNDTITNIALSGVTGANYGSPTQTVSPLYVAVDGSGNLWLPDNAGTFIAEVNGAGVNAAIGTVMTPGTGYSHAGLTACKGVAVDPSGNVWVANNTVGTGGVFELVGVATPTVTPIALALHNNAVGAKP